MASGDMFTFIVPARIDRTPRNSETAVIKASGLHALFISVLLLTGCQQAYYKTMETFGYHKRDILTERVQEARDTQQGGKEQFQSALEKFSAVLNFHGGKLEDRYKQLSRERGRIYFFQL